MLTCPVCGNDTFEDGEYVDVGVGSVKCSPGYCFVCSYVEASPYRDDDLPISFFIKCWELQVNPFHELLEL